MSDESDYLVIEVEGKPAHVTVAAILVNQNGEILLLNRTNPPYGWAGPAGHMDQYDRSPEDALEREVLEETGIDISNMVKFKIGEEYLPWNTCSSGMKGHYWHLYLVQVIGNPVVKTNGESKEIKWVKKEEIKSLPIEEGFKYWFQKLGWL